MFETADPKQPFYVSNQIDLYPKDVKILIKLYQPLVGATAVALYQTLIQDFDPYSILSDAKGVYTLQEQLDCGLKDLFMSLHKLEAVGLVQTFLVDNTVNKVLVFKLLKVPSSQEFFATSLLASLLKEKVGISVFQETSHYFAKENKKRQKPIKNGRDISASFLEVFRLPGDEAINPSQDVLDAESENQVHDIGRAKINERDNIDWDFMKQQFEMYQVSAGEVERKKNQIRGLMQIYGLNEQEFVDESLPSLHGKNELDIHEISNLIAENYRTSSTRKQIHREISKKAQNIAIPKNLSENQRKLLEEANKRAPAEFLYRLKEHKGGFASAAEKQVLNRLRNNYGLPEDLINVLTYTCLTYDSMLTANLAYRIANDWLQHGVANSIQAVQYMEQRRQGSFTKNTQRYAKQKHVEKGTDWSKKKANTDNKINSEELKNFFKNLEDKNGMK